MNQPRARARNRPARVLAAIGLTIVATFSGIALAPAAANALDPNVQTLVAGTPESWAPYLSSTSGSLTFANFNITISCYLTGDTVTGPYGPENVWDEVSGGRVSGGTGLEVGTFVPDADIYTGSNSPVVPRCSTALGTTIGGNPVPIYDGPGTNHNYLSSVASGVRLEMKCYSTGTTVTGPYGQESTWDLITISYFGLGAPAWVPDALVYTGSNSPVVPHC